MSDFLAPLVNAVNAATSAHTAPADLLATCAPLLADLVTGDPEGARRFVETLSWPEPTEAMYRRVRVREGALHRLARNLVTLHPPAGVVARHPVQVPQVLGAREPRAHGARLSARPHRRAPPSA